MSCLPRQTKPTSASASPRRWEFLAAAEPDPICGDENDGDWCELEPGHKGHHSADTAEWAAEETHVVADDSHDPEHTDNHPGCPPAPAGR